MMKKGNKTPRKFSKIFQSIFSFSRFIRLSLMAFHPIVIAMCLFAVNRNNSVVDIVLLAISLAFFVFELGLTYKLLGDNDPQKNRSFLLASNGPLLQILTFVYTFVVLYKFPSQTCFGPIFAVVYTTAAIVHLLHNSAVRCTQKIRLEELRQGEEIDASNDRQKKGELKWNMANMGIAQQFYNYLFFASHNACIYAIYLLKDSTQTMINYLGVTIVANFTLFLVVNIFLVVISGLQQIRIACCFSTTIYPALVQQSTLPEISEKRKRFSKSRYSKFNSVFVSKPSISFS